MASTDTAVPAEAGPLDASAGADAVGADGADAIAADAVADGTLGDGPAGDGATGEAAPDAPGADPVVQLSAWNQRFCAVTAGRAVYCWGNGDRGALGDGTALSSPTPVRVSLQDGSPLDAVEVAVGYEHACARKGTGQVVCWGDRTWGETGGMQTLTPQLQPGPSIPGIVFTAIAARGWLHGVDTDPYGGLSCGIDDQHAVWCWGDSQFDGLGHTPGTQGDVTASDGISAVITANPTPARVAGIAGARSIALDDAGGCVVLTDGTVQCWGWNEEQELGNGGTADSPTPTTVQIAPGAPLTAATQLWGGHTVICALGADHALTCWGRNAESQMGLGHGNTPMPPTRFAGGALEPMLGATVGERHVCAIAQDRTVWCAGFNGSYELGTGDRSMNGPIPNCGWCIATPVHVRGAEGFGWLGHVVELAAGWSVTCARTDLGQVYCWGYNGPEGATGHAPGTLGDVPCSDSFCTTFPTLVSGL
jgi:alpha-tubulin suppressor-like RCC1 family protein